MIRYRPDIDGLRALAVLPVVLFHAGVPWLGGGFVGVDIFFVISGYLITAILLKDIHQDQFNIARFYERRLRRIFPALFVVLALTTIAAALWMIPKDFKDFGIALTGAVFFFSNIVFWRQSGYFDLPAESKPLLHTWSLAVEEQFYIVFPLLLWALHRWLPRYWIKVLVITALASFAYSVWGVSHSPEATFYLAPHRAWELLLGSILACGAFPQISSINIRESFGVAGLLLIAGSVTLISKTTPFPGLAALPPCLGAALIIYSGQRSTETDPKTWTQKLLSWKSFIGIGLISYSLYLWHWPVLVMAQHLSINQLTVWHNLGLVLLATAAAYASWRWVEAPFRASVPYKAGSKNRIPIISIKPLATVSIILMLTLGGLGLFGFLSKGWKSRFSPEINSVLALGESAKPDDCLAHPAHWISPKDSCTRGDTSKPITLALWGDSHAGSWLESLGKAAEEHHQQLQFFGYSGCPPIVGIRRQGKGNLHKCPKYNQSVLDTINQSPTIKTVVLIARHSAYLYGRNAHFGTAEANDKSLIVITDLAHNKLSTADRETLYAKQLTQTVNALREAGKHVVLVYPIPETGIRIPERVAQMMITGHDPAQLTRPADYFWKRQAFMLKTLDNIRSGDVGITRIKPHEMMCTRTQCRVTNANGLPLYEDDDHLITAGVDYLKPLWDNVIFRKTQSYQKL